MGHSQHIAAPDDCILSIACSTGRSHDAVWSANSELRDAGRKPHALVEGDRVSIPPVDAGAEPSATDRRHRFRVVRPQALLRLKLLDMGEPLSDFAFALEVDGRTETGTTTADGEIEVAIPPEARRAVLRIEKGAQRREYKLAIGALDPVCTMAGVQGRLCNLGFRPGPIDGIDGPRTAAALGRFQHGTGQTATGTVDDATRDALEAAHGE